MYLEMLRGKDVILNLNQDEKFVSEKEDILNTRLFKLTELAKLLGVKSVKLLKMNEGGTINLCKEDIFIDYINSSYDNNETSDLICKNCKLVIRVFWDDCNQALALEEIWYEGKKVGFMKYSKKKNKGKLNKVLKQETNFFDIKYVNYDFPVDSIGFDYEVFEDGEVFRRDITELRGILISPEQQGYLDTLVYNEILDVDKRDINNDIKDTIVNIILQPFLNRLSYMD